MGQRSGLGGLPTPLRCWKQAGLPSTLLLPPAFLLLLVLQKWQLSFLVLLPLCLLVQNLPSCMPRCTFCITASKGPRSQARLTINICFNVIKNTSCLNSLVFHYKSWGNFDIQEGLPYGSKFPWQYHIFMEVEILWFEKSDWVQTLLLEFRDTPRIALIDFYKLSSVNSLCESYIPSRLLNLFSYRLIFLFQLSCLCSWLSSGFLPAFMSACKMLVNFQYQIYTHLFFKYL